jgi:uncharacterized membrane protein YkvA (DUF1232 family)
MVIRRDALTLYLAAGDARVPWYAKVLAALVAAYAFSPIDLIPDFIPLLGLLDDAILLPLGILAVIRLIPPVVLADLRAQAERRLSARPSGHVGAVIVMVLWLLAAAIAAWQFWPIVS